MKLYRKRPERWWAKQFHYSQQKSEWPEGVFMEGDTAYLYTASGKAPVGDGDYIVKPITNEASYPVPEAVWENTTEEVEL